LSLSQIVLQDSEHQKKKLTVQVRVLTTTTAVHLDLKELK